MPSAYAVVSHGPLCHMPWQNLTIYSQCSLRFLKLSEFCLDVAVTVTECSSELETHVAWDLAYSLPQKMSQYFVL